MELISDVMGAVGGAAGAVLGPVVEALSDPALTEAAARSAELSVEKMTEAYPQLKDFLDSGMADQALNDATNAAFRFLEEIQEWCQQFGEDAAEAFHAVGVLLLRACRAAVKAACDACLSLIAGCMDTFLPCCSSFDITGLVDEVAHVVEELMKDWLKNGIESKGLPGAIIDMLDFAFTEDDDIGRPGGRRSDSDDDNLYYGGDYSHRSDEDHEDHEDHDGSDYEGDEG